MPETYKTPATNRTKPAGRRGFSCPSPGLSCADCRPRPLAWPDDRAATKAKQKDRRNPAVLPHAYRACPCSWSGRPDLNWRPPTPHAGALPGWATPRLCRYYNIPPPLEGNPVPPAVFSTCVGIGHDLSAWPRRAGAHSRAPVSAQERIGLEPGAGAHGCAPLHGNTNTREYQHTLRMPKAPATTRRYRFPVYCCRFWRAFSPHPYR